MDEHNNRIRLAEAMGWKWDDSIRPRNEANLDWPCWIKPNGDRWYSTLDMPDPFTDANDDLAVQKWARLEWGSHSATWCEFWFDLGHAGSYQVGDFARAALKALETVED